MQLEVEIALPVAKNWKTVLLGTATISNTPLVAPPLKLVKLI